MAIEKQTVIDQIEIAQTGAISLRLGLLLVEDGVEIDRKLHRTVLEPGADIDAQLDAVDANLRQIGKTTIDRTGVSRLKAVAGLVHTPDVVKQFQAGKRQARSA